MFKSKKLIINVLMAASVIVVFTLFYIQYFLVRNTFELTKEKYYNEVRRDVNRFLSLPEVDTLKIKAKDNLKKTIQEHYHNHASKDGIIKAVKVFNSNLNKHFDSLYAKHLEGKAELKNVKYKAEYDEIIVFSQHSTDTLLSSKSSPIVVFGTYFQTSNDLFLNHNETITIINRDDENNSDYRDENLKIVIQTSEYANVSKWGMAVLRKTLGIFALSAVLIIAVIALFFIVFRTMIRQKKIAEIKTDFANNITHELKTPLTSVGIILKSLDRAEVRKDGVLFNDLLQTLNRQHIKIQHIVDYVLESAMLNEVSFKNQELNILAFLQQYAGDLRMPYHQLKTDLIDAKIILNTNPDFIDKILNVLIENAQKYSDNGTDIELKSYTDKGFYFIEIIDQGAGIPEKYQPYVFDKFYRLPEQNRHTVKGLGLGLYLAKQTAGLVHGDILLTSKIGEGSTFIIKLPL